MSNQWKQVKRMLLAGFLAGSILLFVTIARTQEKSPAATPASETAATANTTTSPPPKSTESAAGWHARQGSFYKRTWGVDVLGVKSVSSGYMLRFSYRVLDANKAKALNDKKAQPYLVDEATGAKLFIPEMEKVGQLRQTAPPEAGRVYWMVFSNPGKSLKTGVHVDVVIGKVRVDGLVVE